MNLTAVLLNTVTITYATEKEVHLEMLVYKQITKLFITI